DAHARRVLEARPGRDALAAPAAPAPRDFVALAAAGGRLFALERRGGAASLVVLGLDADPKSARVVVNLRATDPTGRTEIVAFAPSPDGKLVAVALVEGRDDAGELRV